MSLLFRTHDILVETASNNPPDRTDYAAPVSFVGNVQSLFGGKKIVELCIEGEARYRLNLEPDVDLTVLTLSSKVETRLIGSTGTWKKYFIESRPVLNDADTDLAYVELIIKEDVFV